MGLTCAGPLYARSSSVGAQASGPGRSPELVEPTPVDSSAELEVLVLRSPVVGGAASVVLVVGSVPVDDSLSLGGRGHRSGNRVRGHPNRVKRRAGGE